MLRRYFPVVDFLANIRLFISKIKVFGSKNNEFIGNILVIKKNFLDFFFVNRCLIAFGALINFLILVIYLLLLIVI